MTPSSTLRDPFGSRTVEIEEHLKLANHLVNPNSGIANDFLNQYNEILLLVENLPILLPEMVEEILAWKPQSYDEYFAASPLAGGAIAIKIYQALERSFRDRFEAQIAKINSLADTGITVISSQRHEPDEMRPEDIEGFCGQISLQLRAEIEKAADLVNHGLGLPPETSQEMADRLMRV